MALRLLTSYVHFHKTKQAGFRRMADALGDEFSLYLDSGAFTAFTKGTPIDLDVYCEAVKSAACPIDRYFMLDVIGDPAQTRANFNKMLAKGLRPIPVVTRGDDLSALDYYFCHSDVVALGSIAKAADAASSWAKAMWDHAAQRHLHLLGVTRIDLLKHLPSYSVDSSAWQHTRRYGGVSIYSGGGRIFNAIGISEGSTLIPREVVVGVRRFGYDPYKIFGDPSQRRGLTSVAQRVTLLSWLTFADDLERQKGTRMYLALAAGEDLGFLADVYREFKEWKQKENGNV